MLVNTSKLPIQLKSKPQVHFGAEREYEPKRAFARKYLEPEQDEFVLRTQEEEQKQKRWQAKLDEESEVLQAVARAHAKETEEADRVRQQSNERLISMNERMAKLEALERKIQAVGAGFTLLSQVEEKIAESQDPEKTLKQYGKQLPRFALKPQPLTELDGPYFDNHIMDMLKTVPRGEEHDMDFFKVLHHAAGGYSVTHDVNKGSQRYLEMMEAGFEKDNYYPRIKEIQTNHIRKLGPNTKFVVNISEGGAMLSACHLYGSQKKHPMTNDFEYGLPFIGLMMHRAFIMNEFFTKILNLK